MRNIILAVLASAVLGTAAAQAPPCGMITENTKLDGDREAPCVVAADNVKIDLNGSEVRCTVPDPSPVGFDIRGRRKVKIKGDGGTIRGCGAGIYVRGGGEHRFSDVRLTGHVWRGVYDGTEFPGGAGAQILESSGNRLEDITAHANRTDVQVNHSEHNRIAGSIVSNNHSPRTSR